MQVQSNNDTQQNSSEYELLNLYDFHQKIKYGLIIYSSFFFIRIILVYSRSSRIFLSRKNIWISFIYAFISGGIMSLFLLYFFQKVIEHFADPMNLESAKNLVINYYNLTLPNITDEDPNLTNFFKQKSESQKQIHFYQNKLFFADLLMIIGFISYIFIEKLQYSCASEAIKFGKRMPKKNNQHDNKYIETNTADPSMNMNQFDEENNNNHNNKMMIMMRNNINVNRNNQEQVDDPDDNENAEGGGGQRDEEDPDNIPQNLQQNINSDQDNDIQIQQIKQISMNNKKMDLEERISQEIEQRTKRSIAPLKMSTSPTSPQGDKKTIDLQQQFQLQLEKKNSLGLDPFQPQQQQFQDNGIPFDNSPTSAEQVNAQQQNILKPDLGKQQQNQQQQQQNEEEYEEDEEDEFSFSWKKNCIDVWKKKDHRMYFFALSDLILNLYDGFLVGILLSSITQKYAILSVCLIFIKKIPEELEHPGIFESQNLFLANTLCCRLIATIFGMATMFLGILVNNYKFITPFILGNFIAILGVCYPNIFRGKRFLPYILHTIFFLFGGLVFYIV